MSRARVAAARNTSAAVCSSQRPIDSSSRAGTLYYAQSGGRIRSPGHRNATGFHRNSASGYAAIDMGSTPPKLLAKTWFNQEGAVYSLKSRARKKHETPRQLRQHFDTK